MAQATQILTFQTDRSWANLEEFAAAFNNVLSPTQAAEFETYLLSKQDVEFVLADYYVNDTQVVYVRVWNNDADLAAHRATPIVQQVQTTVNAAGWTLTDA